MKTTMEREIKKVLSLKKENEVLRNYEKALDRFDSLIERGVAKSRGNNSLSLDRTGGSCIGAHNKFQYG